MAKGLKPIDQNRPADLSQAVHFGHNYPEMSPPTPGQVRPDIVMARKVFNDHIEMPDGNKIEFWAFKHPDDNGKPFPSTPMRVRMGQVVHTPLTTSINVHTIHHHGIEPSTHNDGVPDTSFNVSSRYTYQWRPSRAGTFFYHCHRNAPLHVQMGMFGFLVVDPPEGPGTLYPGGPRYDAEALWASYDIDPSWRDYNHASGEKETDGVHLNRFNPRYFTVNGVARERARHSPKTTVRARPGQTVLLRHLHAAFFVNRLHFPPALRATVVGSDGSRLARGPFRTDVLETTMAERFDILLRPPRPGVYEVRYEFVHWHRATVAGTATAYVIAG